MCIDHSYCLLYALQEVTSHEADVPDVVDLVFPVWAVAVIVVVNSVIIISCLLIVLGVIWRRYSRLVHVTYVHTYQLDMQFVSLRFIHNILHVNCLVHDDSERGRGNTSGS